MAFVTTEHGSLAMNESAMAELGWTVGQRISPEQMWEGIAANARALCREIEVRGEDIDTSKLASMCGHTPVS